MPELAAELVALKVDLLVASTPQPVQGRQGSDLHDPVFIAVADPERSAWCRAWRVPVGM